MTGETITLEMGSADSAAVNPVERGLLAISAGFLFVNFLGLALSRGELAFPAWLYLAVWMLCALIGTGLIDRRLKRRDPMLFPLAMLMSGWGLVLIERTAPNFAERQALWLVLSVAAMVAIVYVPRVLRLLRAYRYTLLLLGLVLLVATILLGTNPSGQRGAPELWLGVGTLFFQPSEALKVILVVFLASYLAEQYPSLRAGIFDAEVSWLRLSPRIFGPILLMWGLSVVILVWQRDLGTAVLFFVVFLLLLYVASGYTPLLLSGALLVLVAGVVAYNRFDVVRLRIDIWLNPWPEYDGRAFQIVQSLYAFASGGIFGQGVGQGSPIYVPVVHSDFAFAAIAEEWGLLGVIALITLAAIYMMRLLRVAVMQTARPFHTLLAVGFAILFGVQSLLIMGGVLKLLPLTGVTLPFVSYGGSSLLVNFVVLGLLLRLSSGES